MRWIGESFLVRLVSLFSRSLLFENCKNQVVIEGVLIKWQIDLVMWFVAVNCHDMVHLHGESGHDGIFVFLDQLFSLRGLHLHGSSLLDGCVYLGCIGEHVNFFVEGRDEAVGIHTTDEVKFWELLLDDGHDLLKLLDVSFILSLFGVQMSRNQKVAVKEHDRCML